MKVAEQYAAFPIDGVEDWARSRDGLGCDGVIDAAGASGALRTAIEVHGQRVGSARLDGDSAP